MITLLNAEFARLFRSREYHISILFMILLGIFRISMVLSDPNNTLADGFFLYVLFIGIVLAVFISLFIGSEYHYGTLRNKLIIGHLRRHIYLAELIVCTVAGWLFCFVHLLTTLLIGGPLLGGLQIDLQPFLLVMLGSLLLVVVYSSLFVLLALVCSNRTITAIVSLLFFLTLLVAGIQISTRLTEPETYEILNISPEGEEPASETVPNPRFLQGAKRSAYVFLDEFLPGGQTLLLSGMINELTPLSWKNIFYDVLLILISSGSGLLLFCKKDLK